MSNYNFILAVAASETGETRTLIDARAEPRPSMLKVSLSRRWISYVSIPSAPSMAAPARTLAFTSAVGGESRVLVYGLPINNDTAVDGYRWRLHDDSLVYPKDNQIWCVDFSEIGPGEARNLTDSLGEADRSLLSFTCDGRSLVVGVGGEGRGRGRKPTAPAVVPVDGGPRRPSHPARCSGLGVHRRRTRR